jgi:hypothetical protein
MKNSVDMEQRDVLITEVEILLWVLYVIQSIEEEKAESRGIKQPDFILEYNEQFSSLPLKTIEKYGTLLLMVF